jgi:hypothetical protein
MMNTEQPELTAQDVRWLSVIGRLWPELTALFSYIGFLWLPLVHNFLLSHRAWTGAAIFGFVWLTHQERPAFERGK